MSEGTWTISPCPHRQAASLARELGLSEITASVLVRRGYGVSGDTLERLAAEGCRLVLTVDCGITAVDVVRRAREFGLDVIVTDHHRPGDELPDCPVVTTKELCGTGVAFKLGEALLGVDSDVLRRQLDLVALATIADVVPLIGENRTLTIAGLRVLARTQ